MRFYKLWMRYFCVGVVAVPTPLPLFELVVGVSALIDSRLLRLLRNGLGRVFGRTFGLTGSY